MIEQTNRGNGKETKAPKAILVCGQIASGKSVYAENIRARENAVILSCDELILTILGSDLGTKHDEIAGRTQRYLFSKALDILRTGTNVILEWGFWTETSRKYARNMFEEQGFACELHYIDTPEAVWRKNIALRNQAIEEGRSDAYRVDEGLLRKLGAAFRAPGRNEVDVWVVNDWVRP